MYMGHVLIFVLDFIEIRELTYKIEDMIQDLNTRALG